MRCILSVVILGCVVGCGSDRPAPVTAKLPDPPVVFDFSGGSKSTTPKLTKDELLSYLDGKELAHDSLKGADGKALKLKLQKDSITALEISSNIHYSNDNVVNPFHMIYKAAEGTYVIDGEVHHRMIESTRAFYRLKFETVAKQ